MWIKAETKEQLYKALEEFKKKNWGEYINGTEQFKGVGWYWLEVRKIYYNSCTDHVAMAIPKDKRIAEIKEKIKELADVLVQARQTTREE